MSVIFLSKKHRNKYWLSEQKPVHRCQDGWEDLAQAVVLQAVQDYRKALEGLKRYPENKELLKRKRECERFFRSDWFGVLTEVNPEVILKGIQKEVAV